MTQSEREADQFIAPEVVADYRNAIKERLGIDTARIERPLISLEDISTLAGVARGTPGQWRQRSKAGSMKPPMPEPVPYGDGSAAHMPQWDAILLCSWLDEAGRWPPGTAARITTRGPRGPRVRRPMSETPHAAA